MTLVESSHPISDDAGYRKAQHEAGILRWDVDVPLGSGAEGFVVSYRFRIEHDKQMTLAGGAEIATGVGGG